ncbi:MAG: MFS transporter [Patescibacteria group bacterium]
MEQESSNVKPELAWKKWASLFILALGLAIVVIDGTVLNVSISSIVKDLNTDLQSIQWAITTYSLIIASLTIFGGRLGDFFGRRLAFVVGALIFAVGSLITAFSKDVNMLILGWSVVEGIGAALMVPASSSLLVSNFEGKERGQAFGIYGATAGIASAIGPILGGYLTSTYSWRWAFGINVFVVLALVAGSVIIKGYRETNKKVNLDIPGVVLSAVGLGSLTYGLIESSTYGWFSAKKPFEFNGANYDLAGLSVTVYTVLIGIILLAALVWWELREERLGRSPLINMSIFKNRQFSAGIAVIAAVFAGFTGIITFGVVLYYQSVLGLGAFDSGIGLIPLSLALMVTAPISAKLANKFGVKPVIQVGLVLAVVASAVLYYSLKIGATRIDIAPALALFGVGFGLLVSQLTNAILSSVPVSQAGEASGINGTIREVGRTFGTAIIGAVFLSVFSSSIATNLSNDTKIPDQVKTSILAKVDAGETGLNSSPDNQNSVKLPAAVQTAITDEFHQSTVDASRQAIIYTGLFVLLALGLSFFLPKSSNAKKDINPESDASDQSSKLATAH